MIATPAIFALSVARYKPSIERLRRPGKLRALSAGATDTEFRNALAAGAGTIELYDADITVSTTTALTVPPHCAVLDMTGNSVIRAGATNTPRLVSFIGADNSVWACDLNANGKISTSGHLVYLTARDNTVARADFGGDPSGNVIAVLVGEGGRKANVFGCTSTSMWTTVRCADTAVEDGTILAVDALDATDGRRRYIYTISRHPKLTTRITRSILRRHSDLAPEFQHVAQQVIGGRYGDCYEAGIIYQGNGLPFEREKADNATAPNGCADHASIFAADDTTRVGIVSLDGGEAFNVFVLGSNGFTSNHTLAINLDTGIAVGSKEDDPLNPTQRDPAFVTKNGTIRNHTAIGTALDRAEDHGGTNADFPNGGEFGIIGQDADNITLENIVIVGPGTTSQKTVPMTAMSGMKRAAQFSRSTNITFDGLRSHGALLTPEANVSET